MNILIVSGFLGAGKTTFIKELIRRTGTKPVILENEYGDNSIDAQELRKTAISASSAASDNSSSGENKASGGKLEVLEFMEGCVCCTMKDSFVNSVFTVFSSLSPEYLIVEPTGVGQLSKIIENLSPLLHGDVRLMRPVVVVAPRSFDQSMADFGVLYKDQIANAGTVVFSKCEQEDPGILAEAASDILKINPTADIVSSHYSGQSEDWWRQIMELPAKEISNVQDQSFSDIQIDLEDFSQVTLRNARLDSPNELIMMLEDCLRGGLGHVVRAKGTIPVGGEVLRFDLADGLYSITSSEQDDNQCVFIGKYLDTDTITKRMGNTVKIQRKASSFLSSSPKASSL